MRCEQVAGLAMLAVVAVGCGTAANPSPATGSPTGEPTPDAGGDPNQSFQQTIVTLQPDGTRSMTYRTITRAQQLEERQLRNTTPPGDRVPQVLTESCSGNYVQLFDSSEMTGNNICFVNNSGATDWTDFTTYCESFSHLA